MARNLGFDVNPGGTRLVISQGVSLALAWLVCLLRAHVKLFMIKKVRADDWLMLIALVCIFLLALPASIIVTHFLR